MPFAPMLESPQPNVLGSGSLRALSPKFWLLVVTTGVGAGLGGGLLMLLLRTVEHLAWPYRSGENFLAATSHAPAWRVVAVVAAAGLLAGMMRIVQAEAHSRGHGGDLTERIWFSAGRLAPLRMLVQAVVSVTIVGMGAALGREAAPKQTAAVIASRLADWAWLPDSQRRLLVACGAGAGIAAVYNTPLGGAFFALEVLLGTLALPLVPPALMASVIATAVSWTMLPNKTTYHLPGFTVTPAQLIWAAVAGPCIGLAAVLYVRLIAWADARRPSGGLAVAAPILVFCGLGAAALRYPQLLGNGKDVVQQAFLGQLGLPLLASLVVLRPIATAACLGSGAPGGLFTPTVTVGALVGGLLGALWFRLWPGGQLGACAVIGACALLAAATQGPVSALLLMIELTGTIGGLVVPAMLATAGAVLVARLLEHRSIYSARIHQGRAEADNAASARSGRGVVIVSSAARMVELLQAVLRSAEECKPIHVVDQRGAVVGQVSTERARHPPPDAQPLEAATAADFAGPLPEDPGAGRNPQPIGGSERRSRVPPHRI